MMRGVLASWCLFTSLLDQFAVLMLAIQGLFLLRTSYAKVGAMVTAIQRVVFIFARRAVIVSGRRVRG